MHFSFCTYIFLYFRLGMFGVVMNFVCLICAAVRSEQQVPGGWGTFASLDFHRTRKERSCTLANAGICSGEQCSCPSCQREAQPGNFMLPIQGCWSSPSHCHLLVTHLCTPRELPLAQPLCLLLKQLLAAFLEFCMNFDCAFASEYSGFQNCPGVM